MALVYYDNNNAITYYIPTTVARGLVEKALNEDSRIGFFLGRIWESFLKEFWSECSGQCTGVNFIALIQNT